MTIENREMARRYDNLLACIDDAEEGAFNIPKKVSEAIGKAADTLLSSLQDNGINTCNCDGIRNLEVATYAYILKTANSGVVASLEQAEDYGEHIC